MATLARSLARPLARPSLARGLGVDPSDTLWTPLNLGASLLAWWTADRADLLTLNGAQVTSWKDVVANYNLTQAVAASRPLYSATSFNGAPGLTFDGADDCIDMASAPFPTGAAAGSELWALFDQQALVADATNRTLFAYGTNADSVDNTKRLLYRTVGGGQNRLAAYSNGTSSILSADLSGRHVVRGIFADAGTVTGGMDGVLAAPVAGTITVTANQTRIGANCNNTPVQFTKGIVRDAIITLPLSVPNAASLDAYLNNKRMP